MAKRKMPVVINVSFALLVGLTGYFLCYGILLKDKGGQINSICFCRSQPCGCIFVSGPRYLGGSRILYVFFKPANWVHTYLDQEQT